MAVNVLQPTTAEIQAVERVLHEALSDNGVSEPDGFFVALSEAVLEASRDARLREFVAEVRPELVAGRLPASGRHLRAVDIPVLARDWDEDMDRR